MSALAQENFLVDNWKYLLAALAMHAVIGVLMTVTINTTSRTVAPAQLAIQAVVIDNTQKRLQREREQAEAERRAREEAERQRELEEQAEAQRQEEEKQQQAAAEKKRKDEEAQREAAARKQRDAAEKRRVAETKAAQTKKQNAEREAREEAQRKAELQRTMADEADLRAAFAGSAQSEYVAQIQAKIERNWSRPPTARPGISCELTVTQAQGGIVLSVKIGTCNGDQAVRESIETAVNRSSPLPTPSDARLFLRTLTLRFKPDE